MLEILQERRRRQRRLALIITAMVAALVSSIFVLKAVIEAGQPTIDPITLCPGTGLRDHVVLVLDRTDPYTRL